MSNVGWVTTRCRLTEERLLHDLQEVVKNRFPGGEISARLNRSGTIVVGPTKTIEGYDTYQFTMYLETPGCIHSKHPHSSFGNWVYSVVFNDLALHYNGWLSDEGLGSERWRPEAGLFQSYYDMQVDGMDEESRKEFEQVFPLIKQRLPVELQKL